MARSYARARKTREPDDRRVGGRVLPGSQVLCARADGPHALRNPLRTVREGESERGGAGESLAGLLLGAVAIVLLFVAAFVLAPVLR